MFGPFPQKPTAQPERTAGVPGVCHDAAPCHTGPQIQPGCPPCPAAQREDVRGWGAPSRAGEGGWPGALVEKQLGSFTGQETGLLRNVRAQCTGDRRVRGSRFSTRCELQGSLTLQPMWTGCGGVSARHSPIPRPEMAGLCHSAS